MRTQFIPGIPVAVMDALVATCAAVHELPDAEREGVLRAALRLMVRRPRDGAQQDHPAAETGVTR